MRLIRKFDTSGHVALRARHLSASILHPMAHTMAPYAACMNLNPHETFRTGPDGRQQLPQPVRQERNRSHLVRADRIFQGMYAKVKLNSRSPPASRLLSWHALRPTLPVLLPGSDPRLDEPAWASGCFKLQVFKVEAQAST